jgi:hypothetical protein
MRLPKSAKYAYLKDDLGLMQIMTTPKDSSLSAKLLPRYPLLGGWSTEMLLGYSLPLPSTVARRDDMHTVTFLLGPLLEFVCPLCHHGVHVFDKIVELLGQGQEDLNKALAVVAVPGSLVGGNGVGIKRAAAVDCRVTKRCAHGAYWDLCWNACVPILACLHTK